MNPNEYIKGMEAVNAIVAKFTGKGSSYDLALKLDNRIKLPTGLESIGAGLAIKNAIGNNWATQLTNDISAKVSGISPALVVYDILAQTLMPFDSGIVQIIKNHNLISQRLSSISAPSTAYLNSFSAVEVAIRNISTDFLKFVPLDDYDIAEEEFSAVENVTSSIAQTLQDGTRELARIEDLEIIKNQIVVELLVLLRQTSSEKVINYIQYIITVISLALTIYGFYINGKDLSNLESTERIVKAIDTSQGKMERLEQTIIENQARTDIKLDSILSVITKQRIALSDVNLKVANKKRSAVKGIIRKGQLVSIIAIKHKYLLIYYIDSKTNEPKSGYVFKKYFEKVQQ